MIGVNFVEDFFLIRNFQSDEFLLQADWLGRDSSGRNDRTYYVASTIS